MMNRDKNADPPRKQGGRGVPLYGIGADDTGTGILSPTRPRDRPGAQGLCRGSVSGGSRRHHEMAWGLASTGDGLRGLVRAAE